jgi:hypothetical protein
MHRNAPLTPAGRLRLCQRIEAGWAAAHAAASMGISRDRACVWWRRHQAEGVAGLVHLAAWTDVYLDWTVGSARARSQDCDIPGDRAGCMAWPFGAQDRFTAAVDGLDDEAGAVPGQVSGGG